MPAKALPTKQDPPKKPTGLSKAAKKKWDELIKLLPADFLTPIDGYEIKILVTLLCQADALTIKLESDKATEAMHRIYLNVIKQIHHLSAAFGLNPADRARLNIVDKIDEYDPLEDFMLKMHGPRDPVENSVWRQKRKEENDLQLKRRREERNAGKGDKA